MTVYLNYFGVYFLYQLVFILISTKNHNGIPRISASLWPRGLIGTKSDHCLSYVLVPILLKPLTLQPKLAFNHCEIVRVIHLLSHRNQLFSIDPCNITKLVTTVCGSSVNSFCDKARLRALSCRLTHSR